MRYLLSLPFLLGWTLVFDLAASDTSCYWPDGSVAKTGWTPCPDSKTCCATGESCLSNGLCYGATLNIAYRGACIDKSWPSSDCPHVCHDIIVDQWANLYACPNNTNQVFTCAGSGWASITCDPTNKNTGLFTWPSGFVSFAVDEVSNSSSSSISTSTTSATASGTTTLPQSITSSFTSTATPTSTTNSTAATSSSASDRAATSSSAMSTSAKVGLGVGLGVGIPLMALSGYLFSLLRSERKERQQQMQELQMRQNQLYQQATARELPANTWSVQSSELPLKHPAQELASQGSMI